MIMDKFKKPFVTLNMGIGHETYLESLFFPRDIRETYSQNRIFVGWRREYTWERFGTKGRWYTSNKKEGKRTYIDTSKSFRMLILGETGSGKTVLLRALLSRLYKSNFAVCHLSDIKNEMRSNWKPVQEEFWDGLKEKERPEPIPTQMFVPIFFKKFYNRLPDHTEWIQFSMNELSENDLLTLFGVEDKDIQADILKRVYSAIQHNKINTFDEMRAFIQALPSTEVHSGSKRALLSKITDLQSKNILGTEYAQDIVPLLNGYIDSEGNEIRRAISFNCRHRKQLAKEYLQAYMAVIIEKLREARRERRIKQPLFFFMDEAHAFIPNNSNPACKQVVIDSINEDRQYGISWILSTQYPSQIPLDVVKQMQYYFLPQNIKPDIMKDILKMIGIYRADDWRYDKWLQLKDKMKRYEWLMIDNRSSHSGSRFYVLKIATPLCRHISEIR